ncbi:Predicted functional analog of homoserine kinase [hydrothermal vent metagenome]|uniref:Predicted functional analog of homoserine kinase n=1 Tax=hydrothermal vent metagenome TaxID=652676 RepID=A0A3B1C4Q8_9ZZZZ
MRKLKYVILLGDGMPDRPIVERDNKTPLMMAKTPNLDFMASAGSTGSVITTPDGFAPGSDVTNMGILGFDPKQYYTGRAPLEASAMGVSLGPDDVAFRCNLVSLKPVADGVIMDDFSAGHIETEDAGELIKDLNEEFGDDFSFHPGVSYRHLMVWKGGKDGAKLTPPHDISDQNIRNFMPSDDGSDVLNTIMSEAQIFLKQHKVNAKRKAEEKKEANSIWLWGQGKAPSMPSLKESRSLSGAMITAVDLMRGLAVNAGMRVIDVPGATGWIDTNYEGKATACLTALKEVDLVYLHVEAPDEAGHAGSLDYKIQAISDFDKKVVGPVLEGLKAMGDFRAIALSDHATPLDIKTHSLAPVPFAIYPAVKGEAGASARFDESIVESANLKFDEAVKLFEFFIEGER